MTPISLDQQDEAVKRFVLSLSRNRHGSVVVLDGQEVLRAFPPEAEDNTDAFEWTAEMNERRCELIDKQIVGAVTAEESRELEDLQHRMLQYRNRVAPLPLAHARALLEALEQKAAGPKA